MHKEMRWKSAGIKSLSGLQGPAAAGHIDDGGRIGGRL